MDKNVSENIQQNTCNVDKKTKRKKEARSDRSPRDNSENSSTLSDFSFQVSVTPPLLPENKNEQSDSTPQKELGVAAQKDSEPASSSSLTENIEIGSLTNSENDRSLHELELSNYMENMDLEKRENSESGEKKSLEPDNAPVNTSVESVQIKDLLEVARTHSLSPKSKVQSLNDTFGNDAKSLEIVSPNSKSGAENTNKTRNRIKDLEEQLANKETALAALSAEVDALKEMSSNFSTMSLGTTTTEYKALAEEYQNKFMEYQSALVQRDELIQQLTQSLEQSLFTREQLQKQTEHFAAEIANLRSKLAETSVNIQKWDNNKSNASIKQDSVDGANKETSLDAIEIEKNPENIVDLNTELNKIEQILDPSQSNAFENLKMALNIYISQQISRIKSSHAAETKILLDKFENEKTEHNTEIARLRELLSSVKCGSTEIMELRQELDAKHSQEMEELRTYFEQKCADMEKHYSEEVFSQQSRRLSGSSSCSESELASDVLFSGPPALPTIGPGGDSPSPRNRDTHKSPSRRHQEQLDSLKSELETKHKSEIDELRNDYESKVEFIMSNNDTVMQSLENKYVEQIESLKNELVSLKTEQLLLPQAEPGSASEEELAEVVLSYERRLHEQVELAKHDILAALETQIQTLIENNGEDKVWPSELLQLRDIFTRRYESEMTELKEKHSAEIAKLKEDHERYIVRSAERQNRRSKDLESQSSTENSDLELVFKERDCLKKMTNSLRQVIGELITYFSSCEDELNATLVEELVKYGFDTDKTNLNDTLSSVESEKQNESQISKINRVHFAPDISKIMTKFNENTFSELYEDSIDLSSDFRNELTNCLKRLKSEASSILTLSATVKQSAQKALDETMKSDISVSESAIGNDKVSLLTRQLKNEIKMKNELSLELSENKNIIKNLESDRDSLEEQLTGLIAKQNNLTEELDIAKQKIVELINGNSPKEIITEGYGESGLSAMVVIESPRETLVQALEHARLILSDGGSSCDHNELMTLIDVLWRAGHKAQDDAQKDILDLQSQVILQIIQRICCQKVEAADKKLRATVHFLEEQATERESERDEAQRELETLRQQLNQRERECAAAQRIASEVEQLEQQMREMSAMMAEADAHKQDVEAELKEAVDKILILRDIIGDLESQVKAKTESEQKLQRQIVQLQTVLKEQTHNNEELTHELDSLKSAPDNEQLTEHVIHLEHELTQWRVFGTVDNLQQIQVQLLEIEASINKQTKDLEQIHAGISTVSCSSPSEDVSVAEKRGKRSTEPANPSTHPADLVSRISNAVQRHSRLEDAAYKRIKDLEMHVDSIKRQCEEIQLERDALQERLSEQLTEITTLQMRLEEQRRLVQTVTKQSNMSLENKIYDQENEIRGLKDTISARDKQIKQLINTLEKTKDRLKDTEKELSSASDSEKEVMFKLQSEINKLVAEKQRLESENETLKNLPELMDKLITEKNSDIDKLQNTVEKLDKKLEFYSSLNMDDELLKQISDSFKEQSDGRNSARTLSDVISFTEFGEADVMRREAATPQSLHSLDRSGFHRVNIEKGQGDSFLPPPELSTIHFAEPKSFESNHSSKSTSGKRVHFEDSPLFVNLKKEIDDLKQEVHQKDAMIDNFEEQLSILPNLEKEIITLQEKIGIFDREKQKLQEQFESMKINEIKLKTDLDECGLELSEKTKQLDILRDDIVRRDDVYINVVKEKQDWQKKVIELESQLVEFQTSIAEKTTEIQRLETKLKELSMNNGAESALAEKLEALNKTVSELNEKYENKTTELECLQDYLKSAESQLLEKTEFNEKLVKDLENKNAQIENYVKELEVVKNKLNEQELTINELNKRSANNNSQESSKIKMLVEKVNDRECEIEILNEDINKYQDELTVLQNRLKDFSDGSYQSMTDKYVKQLRENEESLLKKNAEVNELQREITHLQEYLKEKDKIIKQMSEDCKSLHIALETIQNKMQETGNIVDLTKKLKEEQRLNHSLQGEVNSLRITLSNVSDSSLRTREASIGDIAGQVRRELDYSAMLDSNILNAIESEDNLSLDLRKEKLQKVDNFNIEVPPSNDKLTASNPGNDSSDAKLNELNEKIRQLEKEKADSEQTKHMLIKEIEEVKLRLLKEQELCKQLKGQIENDDEELSKEHLLSANIMESLRLRLEVALKSENELEKMIAENNQLKNEFVKMQTELGLRDNQLKGFISEREKLQQELDRYSAVKSPDRLLNDLHQMESVIEENGRLKTDLEKVRIESEQFNRDLLLSNEQLALQKNAIKKLCKRLESAEKNEKEFKNEVKNQKEILAQKSRESDNSRLLLNDLDVENRAMKTQIEELRRKLISANERELELIDLIQQGKDAHMNMPVPEEFLQKIQELKNLLGDHMKENKRMADTLAQLTDERKTLQERIRHLEDQQKTQIRSNAVNDNEIEERTNHLFGKYLRAESYRKALTFQKRYLLSILASYELSSNHVPKLTDYTRGTNNNVMNKRKKFKSVVSAVIAVHRMRFMVRRWRTGIRVGGRAWSHQPIATNPLPEPIPVQSPRLASNIPSTSGQWYGTSPPSRDAGGIKWDYNLAQYNSQSLSPLRAPTMISQYMERFDHIQHRLGLALQHPPP